MSQYQQYTYTSSTVPVQNTVGSSSQQNTSTSQVGSIQAQTQQQQQYQVPQQVYTYPSQTGSIQVQTQQQYQIPQQQRSGASSQVGQVTTTQYSYSIPQQQVQINQNTQQPYQVIPTVQLNQVQQQPIQYVNSLSYSQYQGGVPVQQQVPQFVSQTVNSNNLSGSVQTSQSINTLKTPDRPINLKNSNVRILTPNKSPIGCKIVFGASPTKKQIQQEIDAVNQSALTQSQICQQSLDTLKENIQFLSSNNSSPEKRQTAKSLLVALNGPAQ